MIISLINSSIIVLALAHIAATLVGAGSITVAEWQYFRALSDGRIDDGERSHLVALFFSLRFALILVLLIDILLGFILFIFSPTSTPVVASISYWFEMLIVLTLILISWLRFHGRIPFWIGSAVAFTGWWYLAGIDLGYVPVESLGASIIGFIISIAVIAGLFSYARFFVREYVQKS